MTIDNMKIWNEVKQPPKEALKEIKAGRLKGFSDINPQWRFKSMTEQFGPVGIGWYYEVPQLWLEKSESDGQVMAFAIVHLFIKDGEGWSKPIVGIGGSTFVAKESAGLRSSDECFKMALTDALSVCMKSLGVAADIYLGAWDGTKYREEISPITSSQVNEIHSEIGLRGVNIDKFLEFAKVKCLEDITTDKFPALLTMVKSKPVIADANN